MSDTLDPSWEEVARKGFLPVDLHSGLDEKIQTDVPVPDRPMPREKLRLLVNQLRLSQMIGLLVWMNRNGVLSAGGEERLLYLQAKASFEAIEAGLKFAQRLQIEKKLQSDFYPHMTELNRRPQSKRYRRTYANRMGIGYRDKGTLPDPSSSALRKATEESWIPLDDLPDEWQEFVKLHLPSTVEEGWVSITEVLKVLEKN